MKPTDVFLAELRRAGITLRANGDRLTVEAPVGLVTPRLREELARRKTELLSTLEDLVEPRIDPLDKEVIRDVAKLLAAGYRRYLNRSTVSVGGPGSPADGVAFAGESSVHEDGSQDAD